VLTQEIEDRVRRIIEAKGRKSWIEAAECAETYAIDDARRITDVGEKREFYRWLKRVMKGQVKGFQVFSLPGYHLMLGFKSADRKVAEALKTKWKLCLPRHDYDLI